jgi:hypothetical protein
MNRHWMQNEGGGEGTSYALKGGEGVRLLNSWRTLVMMNWLSLRYFALRLGNAVVLGVLLNGLANTQLPS